MIYIYYLFYFPCHSPSLLLSLSLVTVILLSQLYPYINIMVLIHKFYPSQCIFPSTVQAGLRIPAMESVSGIFGGHANGD